MMGSMTTPKLGPPSPRASNGNVTCEDCSNCLFADFGYSNYTQEGTTFTCMTDDHPDDSFDRFYGEDKRMVWARWCGSFSPGEPLFLDVDMECLDEFTPEELERYTRFCDSRR